MIRLARFGDCALLPGIETSAGALFRTIGMDFVADAAIAAPSFYLPAINHGLIWVAADDDDHPMGFCACTIHGGFLYVDELAVAANHQRRGVGRALMAAVIGNARDGGRTGVALRTFRDVAWNAPFYRSLGFEIGDASDLQALMIRVLAHERQSGLDPSSRCTMILPLSDGAL